MFVNAEGGSQIDRVLTTVMFYYQEVDRLNQGIMKINSAFVLIIKGKQDNAQSHLAGTSLNKISELGHEAVLSFIQPF